MTNATALTPDDRRLLLRIVEESYDRSTWNDTNLRSSIKGVSVHEARWRPRRARRNVAEIVLHCAYWKYIVRRRLVGGRRKTFPLKGSNWFDVAARLTEGQWADFVALLQEQHKKLCQTLRTLERDLLYSSSASRERTRQVFGVAMHDVYHTGQIRLIRALYGRTKKD